MGWLHLLRLLIVFALFYVALPFVVQGRRPHVHWAITAGEAFANLSFFLQFTILILGTIRLAHPGAVLLLYSIWIAVMLMRRPSILPGVSGSLLESGLLDGRGHLRRMYRTVVARPRACAVTGLWTILLVAYLSAVAWFPVHNLRFIQLDNYSRALSLAVLSAGQSWQIDPSVPYLEPLLFLSALPSPLVISLSGPVFGCLFVLAVGFLTFQYSRSRLAAFLAGGLSILVPAWHGALGNGEFARPEMAATFALVALGLAPRAPRSAILAAVTGASMLAGAAPWMALITGIACAVVAIAAAKAARLLPVRRRPSVAAVAALGFTIAICAHHPPAPADGPFQYESAARVCDYLARTHARNTWAVISPSQELPFTYGRGWHVELTEFVSMFSQPQVADPSFRFPYPVRDVFFFIERRPLWPGRDGLNRLAQATIDVTYSGDPILISYFTPLGRAALQFRAGELLAAYAKSHTDLETFYADDHLSVHHVAGSLDRHESQTFTSARKGQIRR